MTDYITKHDAAERRYISPHIEIREEEGSKTVEGIAAVVDSETRLGWFREKIDRGAFDGVLNGDTMALFNHDSNYPLARTTATGDGKLDLFINDNGDLGYRYKTPNTTVGKDLAENIRSGVIKQSSFAFTIEDEEWITDRSNEIPDLRVIKKVKRLYDVSPVTFPAYSDTSVAARNLEKFHAPEKEYHEARKEWAFDLMKVEQLTEL